MMSFEIIAPRLHEFDEDETFFLVLGHHFNNLLLDENDYHLPL